MAQSKGNRVRTTEKSFRILELLQQRDGAGVTELSEELGMNKSTVHSHLSTLVACGYATQHDQQYHLSTKMLRLGDQVRDRSPLYKAAIPEMASLAKATEGVVRLYLKDDEFVTLIAQEGHHPNVSRVQLGTRTPMSDSVVGSVMMAGHDDDENLPQATEAETDGETEVPDEFERIRRRGFAVDVDGRTRSTRTFAAAISRRDGTVVGTLTVSVPADIEESSSSGEKLLSAAERTELSLTSWYDSEVTFSPKHSSHGHPG